MRILFILTICFTWFTSAKAQVNLNQLIDSSFYMPVEDDYILQSEGLAVVGKISTGKVSAGQRIDIMGMSGVAIVCTISSIYKEGNRVSSAVAGEYVALIVPGVNAEDIMRGMVAIQTDFGMQDSFINAELEVLPGSRSYTDGNLVNIYINGIDIPGCEIIMEPGTTIDPGQKKIVRISCPLFVTQIKGLPFWIREINPYRVTAKGFVLINDE